MSITEKIPILKPIFKTFYRKFMKKYYLPPSQTPIFSGWGMTTISENPWNDNFACSIFRQSCEDVKKFEFTPSTINEPYDESLDMLQWRHYLISFCTDYALKFAESKNFVECGVNDGVTAYFALNEIANQKSEFQMHLYDSWSAMKQELLLDSELDHVGAYNDSSVSRTKSNLKKFEKNLVFHEGFVPETFKQFPDSPSSICYLHIDLNSAKPTIDTLNFFLPKLVKRGIIIFDDYGGVNYPETKTMIDEFFSKQDGILFKVPTGQAIFFNI